MTFEVPFIRLIFEKCHIWIMNIPGIGNTWIFGIIGTIYQSDLVNT